LLSNDKDNFERGRVDNFGIQTTDLGDIKNVTIGHNGRGFGSAWFLDKVFIINPKTNQRWVFPCNRWMAKNEDDGKIERTLFPADGAQTTYCIKVKTGLEKGAGTDANVHVILVGDKGNSPKLELKNSLTNTNKFERGCLDIFNMDSTDVGTISKLTIGHDNSGFGASWFLDCVEVINYATNDTTYFSCNEWFDKGKGDKKIERELTPGEKTQELKDEYTADEDDAPKKDAPKKEEKEKKEKKDKKDQKETKPEEKQPVQPVSPRPAYSGGTVTLDVIAGRSLASKDSNGLSDPYCEIYLLDENGKHDKKPKHKTKVIKKSLSPEWKETFTLETNSNTSGILIQMFDEDKVGTDEFMGRIILPTTKFQMDAQEWITLEQGDKPDEVSGDICVKVSKK